MALTTPQEVRSYPKSVLPFIPFSLETMRFFLQSRGILPGVINSVVVAVITLILSTLIAAPAATPPRAICFGAAMHFGSPFWPCAPSPW